MTVGSLMSFLQAEMAYGNVDSETEVFLEIFLLSQEEEILKSHSKELGYHIPDDIPAEVVCFRPGVWQGYPNGIARGARGANTVAFSCYLGPKKNAPFFDKATKIKVNK
jgi:hypothetical protein